MLYRMRCAVFELIANNGNGGYRLQFAAAQLPFDVRDMSSVEVYFPIIRVCILAPFHFDGVDNSCNSVVLFYQRRAPSPLCSNDKSFLFPRLQ